MSLNDIVTSEVRVKLLATLFSEINHDLYVRELTRKVGTEVNAIRRELQRLLKAGIVKKEQRGNRLYYTVRKEYVFYQELLSIVVKEYGIGRQFIDQIHNLGKLKNIIISINYLEGQPAKPDQLDLLLVGEVNLDQAEIVVKNIGQNYGREINYTVLTDMEFNNLKARKETFLMNFLTNGVVTVYGNLVK